MPRRPVPTRSTSAHRDSWIIPFTLTLATIALSGCGDAAAKPKDRPPMVAEAVTSERRSVPDLYRYPGTTQAVQSVMIVARVTGYLEARHFKEGTMVAEGDALFTIEPAPFEAAVISAQGRLEEAMAQAAYARIEFERNQPLGESGAISASEWDRIVAACSKQPAAILKSRRSTCHTPRSRPRSPAESASGSSTSAISSDQDRPNGLPNW
jgi:multidrug efflux pump subunit AcrA (membrane-fusion protein)